jgi:hypothetical protein
MKTLKWLFVACLLLQVSTAFSQQQSDVVLDQAQERKKQFIETQKHYNILEKRLLQKEDEYKDIIVNNSVSSIIGEMDNIKRISEEIEILYGKLDSVYTKNKIALENLSPNEKVKYSLKKNERNQKEQYGNISLIRDILKENEENDFRNDDIYNPINFTTITERMPKAYGRNKSYLFKLRAGLDYIKKGSQLSLSFKKEFISELGSGNLDLQVLAYIQRKDKTIKPLTVFGFTDIETNTSNTENIKNANLSSTETTQTPTINYEYKVKTKNKNDKSYSGEINLAWEEISDDDKIILHINNKAKNNTGFSMVFVYDDFGWKQGLTGGFSFAKIAKKGFTEFSPAASIGYSFRRQPRKSSSFLGHFFSPAFGPVLNVFQNEGDTTVGAGLFLSSFYNMVSVSGGWTINGVNHNRPYIAIGLNFIESYNTITNLVK